MTCNAHALQAAFETDKPFIKSILEDASFIYRQSWAPYPGGQQGQEFLNLTTMRTWLTYLQQVRERLRAHAYSTEYPLSVRGGTAWQQYWINDREVYRQVENTLANIQAQYEGIVENFGGGGSWSRWTTGGT